MAGPDPAGLSAAGFRTWRQRLRLTVESAAAALGIGVATVRALERGDRAADRIIALACRAVLDGIGPVTAAGAALAAWREAAGLGSPAELAEQLGIAPNIVHRHQASGSHGGRGAVTPLPRRIGLAAAALAAGLTPLSDAAIGVPEAVVERLALERAQRARQRSLD